jgi:diaminopimelate epimerase
VKRSQVILKLKTEARKQGLPFEIIELKRHTGIKIGNTTKTLGRHSEIPNKTVVKFYQQFSDELGSRWWR